MAGRSSTPAPGAGTAGEPPGRGGSPGPGSPSGSPDKPPRIPAGTDVSLPVRLSAPSAGPLAVGSSMALGSSTPTQPGLVRVALLLAIAAMAAAVVGARVSMLSGEASGKWQSTVRLEVKRSAGAQESVRYLYDVEVPLAVKILEGRLIQKQLNALPTGPAGSSQTVEMEKGVQTEILKALEPGLDLTKPAYALPGGGVDLGKRLADLRAGYPDQLALDPEGTQAQGDRLAEKAGRLSMALVPFGLCGLLGALAQAFAPRRRLVLRTGWSVLALGIVMALSLEVLL